MIHPDVLTAGGILETKKIGDLALEKGIAMAIHMAESPVACMAAVHAAAASENFLALEYHSADVDWWDDMVEGPAKPIVNGGFIAVPEAPGLGIESLNDEVFQGHVQPDQPGPLGIRRTVGTENGRTIARGADPAAFDRRRDTMKYNNREDIIQLTPLWKGDRFDDGRPRVADDIMRRMKFCTTEEAWGYPYEKGYKFQWEGGWFMPHPDQVLVGRAVTAVFVPHRPDLHDYLMEYGHTDEKRIGAMNSWVIQTIQKDDVVVVDLFEKIFEGTFTGGKSVHRHFIARRKWPSDFRRHARSPASGNDQRLRHILQRYRSHRDQ